ncbi:hypothetical protein [Levilactobacillus brevis]|uniref:hypothetical protein n=1 Tax=Levilactobacillus brevis TaxID=1580 RepID=UPI0003232E87|nr:hypothetical protein [Levilactobacillus brevis]MBU7538915.1 hypothetical protein [Levilactobacillus brevis]
MVNVVHAQDNALLLMVIRLVSQHVNNMIKPPIQPEDRLVSKVFVCQPQLALP